MLELCTYNLNFSFHFGLRVWGLTEVALINLAGNAPPMLSRCSLTRPSFRLKLNLKLWCFRSFSWLPWMSGLQASDRVRFGVSGWGWGDDGAAIGWIPSIQYGSLNPTNTILKLQIRANLSIKSGIKSILQRLVARRRLHLAFDVSNSLKYHSTINILSDKIAQKISYFSSENNFSMYCYFHIKNYMIT